MNKNLKKNIFTGSAGFICYSLCVKLLERGDNVIGFDNHNNYYDPKIKEAHLKILKNYSNYKRYRIDLCNKESLVEHLVYASTSSVYGANTNKLKENFIYKLKTSARDGINKFIKWYKNYHQI